MTDEFGPARQSVLLDGRFPDQVGSMATIVETKNLADLYDLPPVDWLAVTAPLDQG
jgi:hypothetical protein